MGTDEPSVVLPEEPVPEGVAIEESRSALELMTMVNWAGQPIIIWNSQHKCGFTQAVEVGSDYGCYGEAVISVDAFLHWWELIFLE